VDAKSKHVVRRKSGTAYFVNTVKFLSNLLSSQIAITGAASGMGLSTAQLLASKGARISLSDINEDGLKAAVASLLDPSKHMYTVIDVRKSSSVNSWIQTTVNKMGRLDGAVNMAGVITTATPVVDMTDEAWDFNFDVNARGVFFCVRAELKAMSAGGSIVSWSMSERH
jgi:arginine metabolism regulation protein II